MENFQVYKTEITNVPIKISFELHNIPIQLANSLRRILSARIPTVAFDDTWDDDETRRSIIINKNTSGLHNEFLSHRLALIPLNMNQDAIKISTEFNINTGKRNYNFINEITPIFELKKKNNIANKSLLDKNGMLNVYTTDFSIQNASYNISDFFIPDPHILSPYNPYIIINKLKSNLNNEDDGEELDLICKPTIGYGWLNARYDPTGTVTYAFKTDNESEVEKIFNDKLNYINNERRSKNLDPYTEIEVQQLRNSFNLLDKERVYTKNTDGTPSIFEMSIETIGFMRPTQILTSGFYILKLLLSDLKNSINITSIPNDIMITTYPKLSLINSPNYEHGWIIRINDEDHTLGNLIGKYGRDMFNKTEDDLMKYISYKMNHPLINNVDIILTPHLVRDKYIDWINKNYYIDKPNSTLNSLNITIETITNLSDYSFYQFICISIFLNTINKILFDLQSLIDNSNDLTSEISPIFTINDPTDYYSKYQDF
jgi:DNA-directed RNA polymerase subunit L